MAGVPTGVVHLQHPVLIGQLLGEETCSRSSQFNKNQFRKPQAGHHRHDASHTLNNHKTKCAWPTGTGPPTLSRDTVETRISPPPAQGCDLID